MAAHPQAHHGHHHGVPLPAPIIAPAPQAPHHHQRGDDHDNAAAAMNIPSVLYDKNAGATYTRGKLLGKGGFARCYEVTDIKTRGVIACKVVNKKLLSKQHQREKMAQEIQIHREIRHEFVVRFLSYFEDDANVYITLELCTRKSLMELQKRRRVITEPEAKYFLRQICVAIQFLHDDKHVIHRDLKLGNIFISEEMTLKVGDFGLATEIQYDGERKKTLCGTPNYIAPEVLGKKGHSYEVDIWSIGCILYTLLIGKPPFETSSLRDTYHKIKRGEYYFPTTSRISQTAKSLLIKLLQVDPALRPPAREILRSEFLTQGTIPASLPPSVLTMAPRFNDMRATAKPMLPSSTGLSLPSGMSRPGVTTTANNNENALFKKPLAEIQLKTESATTSRPTSAASDICGPGELTSADIVEQMKGLRAQIRKLLQMNPQRCFDDDESEDPSQAPMMWICKWVDYSDKYGFGYHLSDDSIGVSFNDQTKIVLLADLKSMHYIEKTGKEEYYTIDEYPQELHKKVKLLKYFQQYMQDNLMKATGGRNPPPLGCIARVPNMWTWFRTSRAVVMVLTNGTLQINNFRDHSKMIVCPLLGALTTLGANKNMRTHKLSVMENGLTEEMYQRLKYALEKIEVIIGNPRNQTRPTYVDSPGSAAPANKILA